MGVSRHGENDERGDFVYTNTPILLLSVAKRCLQAASSEVINGAFRLRAGVIMGYSLYARSLAECICNVPACRRSCQNCSTCTKIAYDAIKQFCSKQCKY